MVQARQRARQLAELVITSKDLGEEERALLASRAVAVLSKASASRAEAMASVREALKKAGLAVRSTV